MVKSITFILPNAGRKPVGGFKVVYEYANCMVSRGYLVNAVHPARTPRDDTFPKRLKAHARFLRASLERNYGPRQWFTLDPRVKSLWVPSLAEKFIPDADAIIATSWPTAELVANYGSSKGTKYYLIQHFENWTGPANRVLETWSLPLRKIVIARWLGEIAASLGQDYAYIPNGLDFSCFGIDLPIETRDPRHIMMLYHAEPWKGCSEGLQAIELVRRRYPDLRVTMYGVPDGAALPQWVSYHRMPTQTKLRSLYNAAAIFLAPSWSEGWGLPACEAMMCGAAVVATDIGGHREFAQDGVTALLAAPKDPRALAERVFTLMENPARRIQLARAGHENIRQFTWQRACDCLEAVLLPDS